jgi:arabinofuranan 3-O-arabinosyltransferase
VHATEVVGTLQDVVDGTPLTWRVCDGPVDLEAGSHRLVATPTAQFEPVSLTWRPEDEQLGTGARRDRDRLQVSSWEGARRVVSVTAGPAAVLGIAENVNPGWQATLDGAALEPMVLDGWQQGYRIPAGAAGDVVIQFAPDPWYRGALLAGLASAVLLVGLAVVGRRQDPGAVPVDLTSPTRGLRLGAALVVGLVALVGGGVPLAGGWAVGLVPPVRRFTAALGTVAVLASGVLVATSAGLAAGNAGTWADTAAAFGVGLLLALIVRVRLPRIALRRGWRTR